MQITVRDARREELERDVWSFNQGAQAFYEAMGFQEYRRHMELQV